MHKERKLLLAYILIIPLLHACGGGGGGDDGSPDSTNDSGDITNTSQDYSGETGQATLTSDNSKELATAGASGTKQAVSSDSVPLVAARTDLPFSREEIIEESTRWIVDIFQRDDISQSAPGATAARTMDMSSSLCDSGSVIVDYPDTGTAGNWSIDYDQCTRTTSYGNSSYSTSFDGSVEGTYSQVGNGFHMEYRYVNFTVSVQSPSLNYSETFNMTMTCSASTSNGSDVSCNYYSDYQGYDNRTYRVSEASVSGNATSGYSVTARVYDPDHGYVSIITEIPVTFDCSNGFPSAGRIRIEGANGAVATVEFISCSQYVVTFNGVANTYSWS
ncbi:MAG: hypothetical protein ABW092_19325 [Candidatus Thiodiazotropha sp.]